MSEERPIPQLSGLDASFLHLESERAPMHIGALIVLAPPKGEESLSYEAFRAHLEARLHLVPTFHQRLVKDPLGVANPYWVEAEDFSLDEHLLATDLAEPGGWDQLSSLMALEFSAPLPTDKPLWQILFVRGVDGVPRAPKGAVALITKVHHAAIDGVSGAEILGALFDLEPDPPPPPRPQESAPEAPPGAVELALSSGRQLAGKPAEVAGVLRRTLTGAARAAGTWTLGRIKPPPQLMTAPRTRFNQKVSRHRVWDGVRLDLSRFRDLKNALTETTGFRTTVNDVVLSMCSGALRRYLLRTGDLPKESMVAMAPISVRSEDESGRLGNRVSAMLVGLGTHLDAPLDRLEAVRASAVRGKVYHKAVGADLITDATRLVPFALGNLAVSAYTRLGAARLHRPFFNCVITNVPGPQLPLYFAGGRMVAHIGAGPLFDGMGLILPIFSYDGSLAVGVTSCREMMPNPALFIEDLRESLAELEQVAGLSNP
ncbi:MAG: wax ester/triacylglycerol synthase family O-acyltransferase [Acidobacteriota bacterium]